MPLAHTALDGGKRAALVATLPLLSLNGLKLAAPLREPCQVVMAYPAGTSTPR